MSGAQAPSGKQASNRKQAPSGRQVTSPGHLRIVLPGEWASIPLEDPEVTRKFAQRLVRTRVGRDDRLAAARREAVAQVCDAADKAREFEAHTLAIALEIVPGVPFPASMVGRDLPWPLEEDPAEYLTLPERLARSFEKAEIVELPSGPAGRWREAGVLQAGEQQTSSVSVEYRIPRPDSDELLHLRFTAPDSGIPDIIAQLFDAIAVSVEFTRERVVAAGPSVEGPSVEGASVEGRSVEGPSV